VHVQFVNAILAIFETVVTGHEVQFSEPIVSLYKLAEHLMQLLPSAPLYPLLHLQSVKTSLAKLDTEFAGQAEQSPEPMVFL
jgi:hypothetical protein